MKKIFFPCLMMLLASTAFVLTSCDKDEDEASETEYAAQYFTIENGTFHGGAMPESTLNETITGVSMNDNALQNGSNFISISSDTEYDRFYVGIEGQNGYMEVVPTATARTRADDGRNYNYIIPVTYGTELSGDVVMLLKARTVQVRGVTQPYKKTVKFVESRQGDLTINLTFDCAKDLDLHLLTPTQKHIYYNEREWVVETPDGKQIVYGLDHDSNADCYIDNLNNENIVIPEEAIEDGTYQVYLELYENCDRNIGPDLNWQLTVRYKGSLVQNLITIPGPGDNSMAYGDGATTLESHSYTVKNPVFGKYRYDAHTRTQKYVFNFKIRSVQGGNWAPEPKTKCIWQPTAIDFAKMKDREEGLR